jgi:16S rRNA (cytidine1402-2'-O)-methyltransferase
MPRRQSAGKTEGARANSIASGTGDAEVNPAPARSKPTAALAPGLYLVATPIGHADDVSLRALEVLRRADVIACEDTRVTWKLMAKHRIATPRVAYHEHNAEKMRPALLARLRGGAAVAVVSDAGTPLISDPGFKLVRAAQQEGIPVTAVPGPAAPIAALILSGLPSDRFLFAGFLPSRAEARRTTLAELAAVPATLIFFETAPRLAESLAAMASVLGDRPAAVARELTKLHEEVRRDRLAVLAEHYRIAGPPRGEIVIVVGPPAAAPPALEGEALDAELDKALATMSLRDATEAVARARGLPRRLVYARALARLERRS